HNQYNLLTHHKSPVVPEETHWNYTFTTSRLINPEEEFDPQEAMPEILFTTPEVLHSRILPEHKLPGWQIFLRDLELVILDDADAYTGVYGAHVAMLLRRLRRVCEHCDTHPVFIASCLPFGGARGFVEDLVGLEFAEVSYNSAGASQKKLVLWNPPLVRVQDSPKLLRRNYFDEAIGLVAETQLHLFHTLLLSKSVRLTVDDISNLKAEIVQRFSDLAESEDVNLKVPMISEEEQFVASSLSLADLPLSGFDSVVMTGFPCSVRLVRQEIESVGTEDAEVLTFIVLPQTPLSQHYVKHASEIFSASDRILPFIAVYLSHPEIVKGHLLCSTSELPIRMEDCERFFGDRTRAVFEGMIGEGEYELKKRELKLEENIEAEYYCDNAYHTKVNLNVVSSDFYLIKREGQERALGAVEADRVGEKTFLGAVDFYGDERYRVNEIDKKENTVWVVSEPKRIRTEKLNRVEVVFAEDYTSETTRIGGGLEFTIGLAQAQISEEVLGYAEYTAENVDPDTAESVDLKPKVIGLPKPDQRSFQTGAFFLKLPESNSPEVLHTLAHCIRVSLPAFIYYEGNDLEVTFLKNSPQLEGDVIFVYDNSLYGLFLVRMVKDSIEDILKLSFDILTSCPCESGCASCLYIFDCRELEMPEAKRRGEAVFHNQSFDKEGAIKLLGEILQQDYEEKIQERTQGVHNIRTLENMLKEAQRTLNESISLEVVDAIVYLIEKEELQRLTGTDAIGACVGRDIYVALGLIERKAKDVVAHEYVHVWEQLYMVPELRDANVVPFDGKLASEGFAQWASAKVLQKDGLWEEMEHKERDLWGWDEYGEGYHIMNYIEENLGGPKAVVEFMKAGMLMKDEEEYNIERLIQESGVEDDIKRREQVSRRKGS
nr:DEAD/DEAH box helicase [Deltaproteobacteria bacterium]